jgi:hypothetical protein
VGRYLVSFCNANEIRLAVVTRAGIERDLKIADSAIPAGAGVTGIAAFGDRIYLALQNTSAILVLDRDFNLVNIRMVPELVDLHGIAADGERVIVVSTGTNQVCALPPDLKGNLDVIWHGDVLNNTLHANCVHIAGGATFLSMFGARRPGQMRNGEVIDLGTGQTVLSGLREPHSPFWRDGNLYVLESATGDLLRSSPGFAPRRMMGIVGYARGLAVDDDGFVVGKSGYRDLSRSLLGDWRLPPLLDPVSEINPLGHSGVYFQSHDRSAAPAFVDTTAIHLEVFDIVALPDATEAPARGRSSLFRRRPKA